MINIYYILFSILLIVLIVIIFCKIKYKTAFDIYVRNLFRKCHKNFKKYDDIYLEYQSVKFDCLEINHRFLQFSNIEDTPELRKSSILYILNYIDKLFQELDLEYWIIGGTLLGAVRGEDFIKYDKDGDIGITYDTFLKLRKILLKGDITLDENIIIDINKCSKEEYLPCKFIDKRTGFFTDIFVWKENENGNLICCHNSWGGPTEIKKNIIYPLKKLKYSNLLLSSPNDHHFMLESEYGNYLIEVEYYKEK